MLWLYSIIHLLHHATLVTEMHLWSQRSNHDRRLNNRILCTLATQWTYLILYICFSSIPHRPRRHKKDISQKGGVGGWGNTNVDNSIYIVRTKCELSHFEECRSWRLFAENIHNSIETWLRLRLLPLSRHSSREYFMCHHLPAIETEGKVMSVSCPGELPPPPPAAKSFLQQRICVLIKALLLLLKMMMMGLVCSLWTLFL